MSDIRDRVKAEAEAAAQAGQRAANVAHRRAINREIVADMLAIEGSAHSTLAGSDEIPIAIVTAIAAGRVRHVSIKY